MSRISPFLTPDLTKVGLSRELSDAIGSSADKGGLETTLFSAALGADLPKAYTAGLGQSRYLTNTYLDQMYRNAMSRNRTNPFSDINVANFTPETVKMFQDSYDPITGKYDYSKLEERFKAATDTDEIALSEFDARFDKLNEQQRKQVLDIQKQKKIDLQIASAGENAYLKTINQKEAEYATGMINEVRPTAKRNINELYRVLERLEKGDVNTGIGAEIKTNLQRAVNYFSKDPQLLESITDTELMNSALGRDVFKAIGQLGIGARGIDTPAERDFLRDVLTGRIPLTKQTLINMTKFRLDRELAGAERYNQDLKNGRYQRYQDEFNVNLEPLDISNPYTDQPYVPYSPLKDLSDDDLDNQLREKFKKANFSMNVTEGQ